MGKRLRFKLDGLSAYIELLRIDMLEKSQQHGINHHATLLASQELDYYILLYQRMAKKEL
ncbi:Spo0E family sporulation regulatory protein-aspartic acid phosphatase [Neobacillus sp. SCS-31]|uniref:Spo0E family sporulation regulatory protein-aspartic acid phosphatase n=1 Tax=Neobacillus oceani TaxID=3115292 RepID=UPI003906B086